MKALLRQTPIVVEVGNARSVMGGRAPGSRDPDTCVSGCELSRVYDLTFKSRPEPTGEMAAGVPAGTWRYVESSVGAKAPTCRPIKSS